MLIKKSAKPKLPSCKSWLLNLFCLHNLHYYYYFIKYANI